MDWVLNWVELIGEKIWGLPLMLLLLGTGIFLTIRLMGLQFRYLGYALRLAFFHRDPVSEGDISHFQALMTALAATIGIGNIVGVATAVSVGGLGAIFWMWVTALFGMATKYSEAILAVKYRQKDENGQMSGGPMYYIEKGISSKRAAKFLAISFALFGTIASFGIGNMVQAHSVAEAVHKVTGFTTWSSGIVLTFLTAIVLLGGIKSISRVACFLVPFMAIAYSSFGIMILLINFEKIPDAFGSIFYSAFNGQAAVGGFAGSTVLMAMRYGVARGIFSNEAGLGSAPIVAAAARTDMPGRQAMVSMTGTFLDTLIVCSITGLVIAVTGVLGQTDSEGVLLDGARMTVSAFSVIPGGEYVVTCGIILFAYTTILGWAYYGEKCCQYLFGLESIIAYRMIFIGLILPGSAMSLKLVWGIADITNGLMAIPNLVALLAMSGVISSETKSFLETLKNERQQQLNKK
ncbi:MAG: AGCS family alanine or glycine:cation symporter [Chlamydiales bacterium]|jgi:AGCS family alanine or glycine:cation symporter